MNQHGHEWSGLPMAPWPWEAPRSPESNDRKHGHSDDVVSVQDLARR
jgi:hypothetical protein